MAAARKKRKAPAKKKPRRWILFKLLILLGIGGLTAFIIAIFVMEQELNRIGFFTHIKRPLFQLPAPLQSDSSTTPEAAPLSPPPSVESLRQEPSQPPPQGEGQSAPGSVSARVTEDISHAERKQLQDITSPRPAENLSHDDRKRLEDVLRSR
jgi:hypothetical protein